MRLNGTREAIDGEDYPLTSEELIEAHGDRELELVDGTETVGEVLGRLGAETFRTAEEARHSLYSGVSKAAIGRQGYSDRDPTPNGSVDGHEELSF